MTTIIAFILIFGLIVFFHEFGHFIFAKWSGIMVKDFSIGFGPKLFSYRTKETQYTLRILPIGGFVRMAGEDGDLLELKPGTRIGLELSPTGRVTKIIANGQEHYVNARPFEISACDLQREMYIEGYENYDETHLVRYNVQPEAEFIDGNVVDRVVPFENTFAAKSLVKRALTIFAGPLFNFILAIIIFSLLAFVQGGVMTEKNELGPITAKSPAAKAGLKQGDRVLAIGDKDVHSWNDVVKETSKHPEQKTPYKVSRKGKEKVVQVTPEKAKDSSGKVGRIGVSAPIDSSFAAKLTYGVTQTFFWTKQIFGMIGHMFTGGFSLNMLSGPVGIYTSTEQVVHYGLLTILNWTAALSINLGIVNLLPLPALDGGRLLFFLYELIRRKPIDPKKEGIIHFMGFALLMILMILVTWNDIQRAFF